MSGGANKPGCSKWLITASEIATILALIVAILAWIAPFSEIGPWPFGYRQASATVTHAVTTSTPTAPPPTPTAKPTSVPVQTSTAVSSSLEELSIDDGIADFGFVTWPGGAGAVRFTVTSPRQIKTLEYFVWGAMNSVRLHVYDAYWKPLYFADVVPSPGWFKWNLPEGLVIVSGDFFVVFQWPAESPNGPWLGVDNTPPHHHGRSYLGNLDPESPPLPHNKDEDYMIRVIVQSTSVSESGSH